MVQVKCVVVMGKNRTKDESRAHGADPNEMDGYAGTGLSIYTRIVSRPHGGAVFTNAAPARLAKGRKLPLQELIKEYKGRIRWIEAELRTASAAKREKLNQQLKIKRRRLVELQTAAAEAGVS